MGSSFVQRLHRSGFTRAVVLSVICAALFGAAAGLGVFTFGYADGAAYLTNRPEACANCHVMREHFDAWEKSSHSKFASCNDCHAPHDFLGKYYCKTRNGFFHSLAFTTGWFPDKILITDYNRNVTENACRDCHEAIIDQIDHGAEVVDERERTSCLHCHSSVGHDT